MDRIQITISSSIIYKIIKNIIIINNYIMSIGVIYRRYINLKKTGNNIKPLYKIYTEIYKYQKYWKVKNGCHDYYYYKLYIKNIDINGVLDYIPTSSHYKIQRLTRYREYECLAYDKRYEYLMFNIMGIPHPRVICYTFNGIITDNRFRIIDIPEMKYLIQDSKCNKFFLKPGFSGGTKGTDVLTFNNDKIYRRNGNQTKIEDLIFEASSLPSGYIVQCEMDNQHPSLKQLNPSSVNTLRIITYRNKEEFKILRILLRIGRKGSPFDNSVAGGVFINVNKNTFMTEKECYIEKPDLKLIGEYHPDNGCKLSKFQIPYKNEIINLLDKATAVLFEHTYLGWDIALTKNGPSVIEVNIGFDIDHHQTAAGYGLKKEMYYNPNKLNNQKSKWDEAKVFWEKIEKG